MARVLAHESPKRAVPVIDALRMACARRGNPRDLIYHADHGSQSTSIIVQDWLAEHEIQASMGSTGDCFDNAVAESFYATQREARMHIFEFIEVFCNCHRLHSTSGYRTPAEFEQASITLNYVSTKMGQDHVPSPQGGRGLG